eukprot:5521902-Amphidinium_carterae.1
MNEPAFLKGICCSAAALLEIDAVELAALSASNCRRVFEDFHTAAEKCVHSHLAWWNLHPEAHAVPTQLDLTGDDDDKDSTSSNHPPTEVCDHQPDHQPDPVEGERDQVLFSPAWPDRKHTMEFELPPDLRPFDKRPPTDHSASARAVARQKKGK